MNVSPLLRENRLKAGMDSLHNAEGPLSGGPWGPPFGIELQHNSIRNQNKQCYLDLDCPQGTDGFGERGVEMAERERLRIMSPNKVFGLSPLTPTCYLTLGKSYNLSKIHSPPLHTGPKDVCPLYRTE